jgi:hypothetical protein
MEEDSDDEGAKASPAQKLEQLVTTDPYIQLAVFLLKESHAGRGAAH